MQQWMFFTGILFSFLITNGTVWAENPPDSIRQAIEVAVQKVKPALVQIMVVDTSYSGGRGQKSESAGSGAIITEDGYVVTNHHVAGHASRLVCILSTKEEIDGELIGTDALSDIAVIKLKPSTPRKFSFVSFTDSSKVKVGDWVLAMGSPRALSQSVTFGVVSNIEMMGSRLSRNNDFQLDGENVGSIVKWIGHDAAIYGGNSGGPLVNLNGDIVGVNEIGMGLGGAIPANLAKAVAEQLIQHGRVKRASIGFLAQKQFKYGAFRRGVLINSVVAGSPAEKAGFQSGDILIKLAGQEVDVRYNEDMPPFNQFIMDLPIGHEVDATVLRGTTEMKVVQLKVVPEERGEVRAPQFEIKEWGMTVSNLNQWLTSRLQRDSSEGVYITSTRSGGPCGEAKPAVEAGDVLISIDGTPLKNVEQLKEWTQNFLQGKTEPTGALVTFERGKQQYVSVVKVGIKEMKDPGLEVSKAWFPAKTQVLTRDVAKILGIPDETGVRVTYIYPKSSAEEGGLQVGDLILRLDGDAIPAENPEDSGVFPNMIRQYKIGQTVELLVRRGQEEKTLSIKLIRSPRLAREMKKHQEAFFEFTVRELAYFDKESNQTHSPEEEIKGVIVDEVTGGGWAALGNLLINDIILSVNQEKIPHLEAFKTKMAQIYEEKPKSVVIHVQRGLFQQFIEMEPDWSKK